MIFFAHYGPETEHLKIAVKQASKYGEVKVLEPAKTEFDGLYRHMSKNGHEIEEWCIKRWFILRDAVEDWCLYLDDDVMLYEKPERAREWVPEGGDYAIVHGSSGHTSYWTKKALIDFCEYIKHVYTGANQIGRAQIELHWIMHTKLDLPGGVCDMTILQNWTRRHPWRAGELMHIKAGECWDHIIGAPDQGFEMQEGHKKLEFMGPIPYGVIDKQVIKLCSVHYQGNNKCLMKTSV